MKRVNFFLSSEYEPWFNLALEDWIFSKMDTSVPTLFLWRNSDTVVIGRHQNPWVECNLKAMEEDQVYLARRQSGGGAVYHDLNNTNFTFLAHTNDYTPQVGFDIIGKALAEFGIQGEVSGRNDMIVTVEGETRKFSGSAFRKHKDRSFHHGTLLIKSDLTRLSSYLTPSEKKLQAKGIKSVRSRVINLTELNPMVDHHSLCDAIKRSFFEHFQAEVEPVILSRDTMVQEEFLPLYDNLKDPQWLYGKTPPFNHRMEEKLSLGMIDILFDVKSGIIVNCEVYSDTILIDLISQLGTTLKGVPYDKNSVREALRILALNNQELREAIEEISEFIAQELH